MEAEQQELSEGFDRFVEFFELAGVDYHIGVTTTDMTSVRGALVAYGGFPVITPDTPNAAQVFRQNVKVGTTGSGLERGLDAASRALSEEMTLGHNAGFLREEAVLSVLFVSDEEDISHRGVNEYIAEFLDLKASTGRRDMFNASALIGLDPETGGPGSCGDLSSPEEGATTSVRLYEVARRSQGDIASICQESYADTIGNVGLKASRLLDSFPLERRPDLNSLTLQILVPDEMGLYGEGIIVPPEGTEDGEWAWEYTEDLEGSSYEIRFTDLYSLPPIDSQLIVDYELW